ncbi:MAG: LPS-assembly protein, partial [Motiliproteus sp.]
MPVLVTPLLRGLLFCALLSAPMTALADSSPAAETATATQPQPIDSAGDCNTQKSAQGCPSTKLQVRLRTATSDGIAVDPADTEYRQAYPNGYAPLPRVSAQQQKARQLWQQRSRKASHPEGIGQPQSLFAAAPFAFLDWYPNPTGISPLSHCGGSYIQPAFDFKDSSLATNEQSVYVDADYSRTQNSKTTELSGDVYLRKGNRQARSQQARVDHLSETSEMNGLVQFREPGMLLLGERASVDMGTNEAVIEQAQFVVHNAHLRGTAEKINRSTNGDLIITQGAYTRCPPGDNSWSIQGSNLVLGQESGLGEVTHATLRINEIPVLYFPYLYFPIDGRRLSGLLPPSFSLTSDNGFDLAQPYYFNLAPNYDDTLTFRHAGERGEMLENQFRYLNDYGQFELGLAYLPNDNLSHSEDRWILGVDHTGTLATNWSTRIDYTSVSDGNYFEDLGTDLNLSEQSHLDQLAAISYRSSDFNFEALVQDYQTIDDSADVPYRKLPSLKVTGTPALDNDWLLVDYLSSLISFDRDPSDFSGNAQTTGTRFHLETTLMMPLDRPWGYIHPSLRLTHTQYALENTSSDDKPSRILPLLSVDLGLVFDRAFDYEGKDYTQTLEPRLFYLDVPYQDQSELPEFDSAELTFGFNQLFRDNRFSGLDRIGDTRQTTAGLTTRLLDNQGYERGNASIGQTYYFKDRNVRLSASDPTLTESSSNIVAEGVWNITQTLWISADAEWDRDASTNEARNAKVAYRTDTDHILSFRYRFTRDELEQTDLTMIWPLSPQWSMLGRWQQDLRGKEALDLITGLEFENCCWQVRTVYRQWITDDADTRKKEGLFLQFVLKGLGGSGARAAGDSGPLAKSFLKEITGFEEHRN